MTIWKGCEANVTRSYLRRSSSQLHYHRNLATVGLRNFGEIFVLRMIKASVSSGRLLRIARRGAQGTRFPCTTTIDVIKTSKSSEENGRLKIYKSEDS